MVDPAPSTPPTPTRIEPSPDAIKAVLVAMVLQRGEPLVDPNRIQYSMSAPMINSAAGRAIYFEYIKDDLNPFGRLDLIVPD